MEENNKEFEKRKEKVFSFLKQKKDWIFYGILVLIVLLGTWIRTLNISKLKDVTTGEYTLGPDLDPFLFLRWAEYIVEHGKLFILDTMRSVPLAEICSGLSCSPIDTSSEMKLLSYMIAYFYQFLHFFSNQITLTYAAIIFPVVMFSLSIIAFFLFARKIFSKQNKIKQNTIALIATAFYVVIPSLLSRTIAGIPEKESASYLFIFLAFYFILEAFDSKNIKRGIIFGALAGITTGILGLIWGGVTYVLMTISGAALIAYLLKKIDLNKTIYFASWVIFFCAIVMPFSSRYSFGTLIASTSTGMMLGALFVFIINEAIKKLKINAIKKIKLPLEIISLIIAALIGIVFASIILGPSFVLSTTTNLYEHTINPLDVSRFGLTVAENKKPSFLSEWKGEFGPVFLDTPIYFWLFFLGSVFLFYEMIKSLTKREKILLTFGYLAFLLCLVFSNYSQTSALNGESGLSKIVYIGGGLLLLAISISVYWKRFKVKTLEHFEAIDFGYLIYFVIFTMTIIGARGAIRLIMVLAAVTPIAAGYLVYRLIELSKQEKEETLKIFLIILTILVIIGAIFSFSSYYQYTKASSENFAPTVYTQQWQKAMSWVRENTDENKTVFAHWWDYGYWLQSIGKRSTILDGGNAIGYWNHLMGRHVLTGISQKEALEFLYPHNATNLLIDSTDIGKYTAFSSIGSDENYDRFSWITSFSLDETQTQESRNETVYVYTGGTTVDEDILLKQNNKTILLPRKKSALVGILVTTENGDFKKVEGVYNYNGKNYFTQLKHLYVSGTNKSFEFKEGINAGVFIYPRLAENQIKPIGSLLYLSNRTINSNLANLYLFGEQSQYFTLVHSEEDYVIESLKEQGYNIGQFIDYGGFRGPIKIWNISYPKNIIYHPEYLETSYPNPELNLAKDGEY